MRKRILTAAVMAVCAGMSFAAVADESTTVGGKAYIDFTNIDKKTSGTKDAASGLGFDLTRFYVGIDHVFDDMWSANVTTDVTYDSGVGATQVYIKKAYLQAKVSDAAVVRLGSADMPWIPYAEHAWGYRYVEKALIDRAGFGTSADWGAHVGGKVGMVNYAVSAVNGNGYKNPTRSKGLDFEGRVGVMPVEGLNLAVGFYDGKKGKDVEGATGINTASRWDVLAAYSHSMFNVGAEYFSAENFKDPSAAKDKADGYSVFGSVKAGEKAAVFARYDEVKPNKTTSSSLKDTYYNVGVSYEARKNVDVALAYKNEEMKNNSATKPLEYSEVGLWTQVKF
jgi:hypothetical protein